MLLEEHIYQTTYSVQQHIILNSMFSSTTFFNIYGSYDIFVQEHIYVFKQHIYVIQFYRTYVCDVSLNNINI